MRSNQTPYFKVISIIVNMKMDDNLVEYCSFCNLYNQKSTTCINE